MNVFVFDIETVPDVAAGRRLHKLDGLSDAEVGTAMQAMRLQSAGTDFQRHHLHRVVCISIAARLQGKFKLWTLGREGGDEKDIIQRFFDGVERFGPMLVSWNGGGFDLPVLHYRGLMHGVTAPRYWDTGQQYPDHRFNHYQGRFHERHTDLMDVLAAYNLRAAAPLDEMATLCGLPGKMGMSGSKVWDAFQAGGLEDICDYCETDVLNTYLLYLRFERMRDRLDEATYREDLAEVEAVLDASDKPHLREFLQAWQVAGGARG